MTDDFPKRLRHDIPPWVNDQAIYHIRIRCALENERILSSPVVSKSLLTSVHLYAAKESWSCYLFLLMPDHLHALMSFGRNKGMTEVIRGWKRYHRKSPEIQWQENFFDHRIRSAQEYSEKYAYIERNPVAMGLCARPEEWEHKCCAFAPAAIPRL